MGFQSTTDPSSAISKAFLSSSHPKIGEEHVLIPDRKDAKVVLRRALLDTTQKFPTSPTIHPTSHIATDNSKEGEAEKRNPNSRWLRNPAKK